MSGRLENARSLNGSVILAAQIASQAQGAQILVSSLLEALVERNGECEFAAVRRC